MENPDSHALHEMARAAIDALPPAFAGPAAEIVLRIEEEAAPDTLREFGIDDPLGLTGLYEGIPMTEKSLLDQPAGPDVIRLYRRAILAEWRARGDVALADLVAHVVVHELAHHFGWSDGDIATIDRWWE